ncbi:MAG: aminotransferase class I/II-fold pyridoxal phosphate-dependent enzyme [Polyangiaceae bacterium]
MIDPRVAYEAHLDNRADAMGALCVHGGERHDPSTMALDPPLVLASAFAFESADAAAKAFRGENDAYIYGRWRTPPVEVLEAKLAALEGAETACATASGMAAISGAVMTLAKGAGGHVVAPRAMYAESARLLRERLPAFGIRTTFVDDPTPEAYAAAMSEETRLLYVETPANPNLRITDVRAIAKLARDRGVASLADNTFASPFSQNPIALGIDVVVHSTTKSIGGHGDAIGGVVCGPRAIVDPVREFVVKGMGAVLAPMNAFLVTRGVRTLALRQRQANATAAYLAKVLSEHPKIAVVHHPSLPDHPGHALANDQMMAYGSVLAFEVKATSGRPALEAGRSVLESVRVATHAVSLGDVKTLVVHPASTTHSTMPADDRKRAHVTDGLLRMSVGIEPKKALLDDLLRALDALGA